MELVDKVDKHSRKIGAVNCVYKKQNKKIGTNTDWIGYPQSLKKNENYKKIKKNTVSIIGFGGATRAVLYALKKMKFKKRIVFVRNENKLIEVRKHDNKTRSFKTNKINKFLPNTDLLINTTSSKSLKNLKIKMSRLKKTTVVSDINYSPHKTNFLKHAIRCDKKGIYGIYMLVYQAVPSFKFWFAIHIILAVIMSIIVGAIILLLIVIGTVVE